MKGKLRTLGNIGLALFLVSAMLVMAAPVRAATAVTEVWVEFPDADNQNESGGDTDNVYLIHFKPTTALKRGVDTVTVTFPDGTVIMSGTLSTNYDFSLSTSMTASEVTFTTDYKITATTWTASTVTPVVGGYRAKVTPPINLAAGSDVWVKFDSNDITSATTAGNSYKVYVSTSQDTTPVLSSAFSLDTTVSVTVPVTTVSPATAGAAAQYKIYFEPDTALSADTHTVTIQFPVGTGLPASIAASNVLFADNADSSYTATGSAPIVDQDKRTITATTSVASDGSGDDLWVKILSAAGITNPTRASTSLYLMMVRTSLDGEYKVATSAHTISPGAATKLMVANGNIGTGTSRYSDDATMINMLSSQIFVTLGDANSNAKAPGSNVTVTPSSSSNTGTFYKNANTTPGSGAYSTITSITVSTASPASAAQQIYYKDTAAGTYTLTFIASGYTTTTWTITVAPAVSLYDSSNTLVNTYAAVSTSPVAEIAGNSTITTQKYGVDYITSAISAAMAGDTVKLGDGTYELDAVISLSKKITLTSVNGASSTTLRPTTDAVDAINVAITGTATDPIIIDGLTFDRLRYGIEFDQGVIVFGYDYVTVRNNIFNYILPDTQADNPNGGVVGILISQSDGAESSITSATISNNTFNNSGNTSPSGGGKAAVISIMVQNGVASSKQITGVTIDGNTFNDSAGYAIVLNAGHDATHYVTATVSNNTITNPYDGIGIWRETKDVKILGNTVTGAYQYALRVEAGDSDDIHDNLVIKNNTFTGTAGAHSSRPAVVIIDQDGDTSSTNTDPVTFQYNAIYDNDATYSIYVSSATDVGIQDTKYNWFGDATGPAYTALTGATVSKSNPNGAGKKVTDYATYYPWLHKSLVDVVADNASYQSSTVKLIVGWNTLSTPVQLIAAANSVDELIPSGMTIGYYYSGGWQQITSGYVLNASDAVYVKMNAVTYVLLKFDASAFSTPSKALVTGWNLVGLASLASSGMKDAPAVASVYSTAAGLPGYGQVISPSMNATQTDMYGNTGTSWSYSRDETTGAGTNYMYAGLGYWIYMQNAATLAGFEITPIAPNLN